MVSTAFAPPRHRHQAEQGVVLVVVLVMLLVIAFMSVAVMRGAMTNDLITNNNRTQTLATEMAQLALRFCENAVANGASVRDKSIVRKGGPDSEFKLAWEDPANWAGSTSIARTLTREQLTSGSSAFTPARPPQCLAEFSPEAGTEQIIVLTARGFSPDYTEDASNRVQSGSVVWLQSRFLLTSGAPPGGAPSGG